MARIAHKPIPLPQGVRIKAEGTRVTIEGPKGVEIIDLRPELKLDVREKEFCVLLPKDAPGDPTRLSEAHGLTRTLLMNIVHGVSRGFERKLEIKGIGYRASVEKGKLVMSLGFSHPVEIELPPGVQVEVEKQVLLTVRGANKYQVGEMAAVIRRVKPPEVYKGTGIRYLNEKVIQKAGKAGKAGASGAVGGAAAK